MPMTTYERVTMTLSILAVVTSLAAILKDDVISLAKGDQAQVFIEKRIAFGQRLGNISLSPYVTLQNEGGRDIKLSKGEIDLIFENGKIIKLMADTFVPSDSWVRLRLYDVTVKPGAVWSGRLHFSEEISRNEEELLERLEYEAQSSSHQKRVSYEVGMRNVVTKFMGLMAEDLKKNAPRIATLVSGLEFRERYDPDEDILARAKKIFDSKISRIEKGEHKMVFRIVSPNGRLVYEKRFGFTLYENDLKNLSVSFDGFGASYVSDIAQPPRMGVSVLLKDG